MQRVYHATDSVIASPFYDDLYDSVLSKGSHPNGVLGLWVSNSPTWLKGFGSNLYALDIEGTSEDLPIEELSKLSNPRLDHEDAVEFHAAYRFQLLRRGIQYCKVIETDGRSDMAIVCDFSAIHSWYAVPWP